MLGARGGARVGRSAGRPLGDAHHVKNTSSYRYMIRPHDIHHNMNDHVHDDYDILPRNLCRSRMKPARGHGVAGVRDGLDDVAGCSKHTRAQLCSRLHRSTHRQGRRITAVLELHCGEHEGLPSLVCRGWEVLRGAGWLAGAHGAGGAAERHVGSTSTQHTAKRGGGRVRVCCARGSTRAGPCATSRGPRS